MANLDLTAVTKVPTAPKPERGTSSTTTCGENIFADLMQECAAGYTGTVLQQDPAPQDTDAEDAKDTEGDAISDPSIAPQALATLIPVVANMPVTISIPVKTETDQQPLSVEAESLVSAAPGPSVIAAPPVPITGAHLPSPKPSTADPPVETLKPEPLMMVTPPYAAAAEAGLPTQVVEALTAGNEEKHAPLLPALSVSNTSAAHTQAAPLGPITKEPPAVQTADVPDLEPGAPAAAHADIWPTLPTGPACDGSKERAELPKTLEASCAPVMPSARRAENERAPVSDPQISATPVPTPEPQSAAIPQPDTRVPMASIPHVIVRLASDPEQKTQAVKLRLDPPKLGDVSVDLRVGEHGLSVRIVSQTPEARDLLQQDLPRLQEALKESGLNLQLFSASCDLSGERAQRQFPPKLGPSPRTAFPISETEEIAITVVRRQFDTSVCINAHA